MWILNISLFLSLQFDFPIRITCQKIKLLSNTNSLECVRNARMNLKKQRMNN